MRTVGIIGLGTISKFYKKGLEESERFELKAVCDLSATAPSRSFYNGYPFYTDYREMLRVEALDTVIIATPPLTHVSIAEYALRHGVDVIMEKPVAPDKEAYAHLKTVAESGEANLYGMFHWQTGIEVAEFLKIYDPSKITRVHVMVQDPYSDDGRTIVKSKQNLCGAWLDSGSNALSLLKMWLPFSSLKIQNVQTQCCTDCQKPLFVNAQLCIDGVDVTITVDWRQKIDCKKTVMVYDGREIVMDHSNQCLIDGDQRFDHQRMERLQEHYYGYFNAFSEANNEEDTRQVHHFLFEVDEEL